MIKRASIAFLYGDLFERLVYHTRPYEVEKGATNALYADWLDRVRPNVENESFKEFKRNVHAIVHDFDTLPVRDVVKPKVGVVGEILVKYSPIANNDIVGTLEKEGAEAVVPDIVGFMNYSLYNQVYRHQHLGAKKSSQLFAAVLLKLIRQAEKPMDAALRASKHFNGITPWDEVVAGAKPVLSLGNMTGEGWFLPGEMVELLRSGVNNIVCMQPFGCLPNHIVGKGMLKELRREYKGANLMPIDYDPGASVAIINRIRLMMATAKKKVAAKEAVTSE